MRVSVLAISLLALSTFSLAGCGGSRRGGAEPGPTPSPSPSPTPASRFDVSATVTVVDFYTGTVEVTYAPTASSFAGTLVVERAADGTLVDGGGLTLQPVVSPAFVTGLPQTLSFDGTGAARKATFSVRFPDETRKATNHGIRLRATPSGGAAAIETVVRLNVGIGS